MTVGELIKALQEFNPDLEVMTEGCDCVGQVGSLREAAYENDEYKVYLERPVAQGFVGGLG